MAYKRNRILVFSVLSFFALVLVLCSTLLTYQRAYAGKIYRNVYFSDIDLSGRNRSQAKSILENRLGTILQKEITLSANGKEVKATLVDTGLTFDINKIISSSYDVGRNGTFINTLFYSAKTVFMKSPVAVEPFIDTAKYGDFVNIAVNQLNTDPKNATLKVENGIVALADSTSGQKVDTSNLDDQIVRMISTNKNIIELSITPIQADVENADFTAAKSQAESYLSKKITLAYNGKNYIPSALEIGNWITFPNNNGVYSANLDDSAVKAYLATIAKDFEVKKVNKTTNGSTGETMTEGKDGLTLDKDKALAGLKAQLASPTILVALATVVDKAGETKVFPSEGLVLGRFDGKYIDIDLTQQKFCRIEGANLIDCFIISSGKASTPTPIGTFSILSKNPRAWSASYGLYMPWWEQISGPYGIHELPEWPNGYKEGENHLGTPVSHGCVRLGVGPAETVYNWTDIGTPVYIHK